MSVTSCKSKEDLYKKAYEKAQAVEQSGAAQAQTATQTVIQEVPVIRENVVVPPVQTVPVQTTTVPVQAATAQVQTVPVQTVPVQTTTVPVQTVTPVQTVPVQTTVAVTPATSSANVTVRTEKNVTLVSGSSLKAYSVVVGSFGIQTNAQRLANELKAQGYDSRIISSGTMYRVVAASADSKDAAVVERDKLIGAYPGAWLLYKE